MTVDERRQEIVRGALELLDAGGFDQMSLRRLASHLGMHAPGLYWYIENKQALIDLMAHAIVTQGLSGFAPPSGGQAWDEWMVELSVTLRRALNAHRDGARVVAGAFLLRSEALTPMIEMAIAVLEDAGFELVAALGCAMTLFRFTVGTVLDEQLSPIKHDGSVEERRKMAERRVELVDAHRFPRTAEAIRGAFVLRDAFPDREAMFRWAAQMIVRGMADLRQG